MDAVTAGIITAGAGGLAGLGRWALKLWADVRRETITAAAGAAELTRKHQLDMAAATAAQVAEQRAANERIAALQSQDNKAMVAALLEQARASTLSGAKMEVLTAELREVAEQLARFREEFREHTPVRGFPQLREREPTAPIVGPGYRAPRRGRNDDTG